MNFLCCFFGFGFGLLTLIIRSEYFASPCGVLIIASSLPSASQVFPGGATTAIVSAVNVANAACLRVGSTHTVPSSSFYAPF